MWGVNPDGEPMAVPQQARPGLLGARKTKPWLGLIGDTLSILGGGQAQFVPMMQQQRAFQQKAQADLEAMGEQRDYEWQDWQRKEQWKAQNEKPRYNDTIEDFNWYKSLSPDDRRTYQEMKPVYRQGADGQFYRVDTQGGLPTFTADDWDRAQPTGGPTQPASGGFR